MQWVVVCSDDLNIRVYNYNTLEKIKTWEAHQDFIRNMIVHPSLPLVISCSDDNSIISWNWEKNWNEAQKFIGHNHYVMHTALNPRDPTSFASGSLDRTIKIWSVSSGSKPLTTLIGHEDGVNCVDYCKAGDRPYLVSGSDDFTVKVWDYQSKQCIATLEGHTENVSSVLFHPELPIIISTCEDYTVRIWNSQNFKHENTLNYGMDRAWSSNISLQGGLVALGFDEGSMVIKIGSDNPVADFHGGKVYLDKNNSVSNCNLKMMQTEGLKDGEKLSITTKELGHSEFYIQGIRVNNNGQLITIFGDSDFVIYTSGGFKNVCYGPGCDFAWSKSEMFAVKVDNYNVKIYKNTEEIKAGKMPYSISSIFGGELLCLKSADSLIFYDWETLELIRVIEIHASNVYWNDNGTLIAIAGENTSFILSYSKEKTQKYLASNNYTYSGCSDSFEIYFELNEVITSGIWIGSCFVYLNSGNKLAVVVNRKVQTITRVSPSLTVLGYIESQNKLFLVDRSQSIISHELLKNVIDFMELMISNEFEKANLVLKDIPQKEYIKIAKFLEQNDLKEEAYKLALDEDYKLDLALQLNKFEESLNLVRKKNIPARWSQMGDLALSNGYFEITEECFIKSSDMSSLQLLYSSTCNQKALRKLANDALAIGRFNIAFNCFFLLRDLDNCVNTLLKSGKVTEAAFFARTYCPSIIPNAVEAWNSLIEKKEKKLVEFSLSNPFESPLKNDSNNLIQREKKLRDHYLNFNITTENYKDYMNIFLTEDFEKLFQFNNSKDENKNTNVNEAKIVDNSKKE